MLEPIPGLQFFEEQHRYMYNGEWLAHNVSDIVDMDMTPFKRSMIAKYKDGEDGWAIRGKTIHDYAEAWLNGKDVEIPEKWKDWIEALRGEKFFEGAETLATEYRVVDEAKSCAGSLDFLLRKNGLIYVGDLPQNVVFALIMGWLMLGLVTLKALRKAPAAPAVGATPASS